MIFKQRGGRVFFRKGRPPAYHPLLPLSRVRSQGPVGVFLYVEGWGGGENYPRWGGELDDTVAKNATERNEKIDKCGVLWGQINSFGG